MKLLLDTHVWLWSLTDPERLNEGAKTLVIDPSVEVFLSAASAWEIAIKAALGLLPLPEPAAQYVPRRMTDQGIAELPIAFAHALRVESLPGHHKDPFDRLIVAQAQLENCAVLSADQKLRAYDIRYIHAAR